MSTAGQSRAQMVCKQLLARSIREVLFFQSFRTMRTVAAHANVHQRIIHLLQCAVPHRRNAPPPLSWPGYTRLGIRDRLSQSSFVSGESRLSR